MGDTSQVEVYNPQGKLGTIPSTQLDAAKTAGYKPKSDFVEAVHPKTGQTGIIPKSQWDAAQKQGYTMSARDQQRAKAKAAAPIQKAQDSVFVGGQPYGGGGGYVTGKPEEIAGIRQKQRQVLEAGGAAAGGELVAPLAAGAEAVGGGSKILQWLLPALTRSAGVGTGVGTGAVVGGASPKDAATTGAGAAALTLGGEGLVTGAGKVVKALTTNVDPLAKLNKLLGVGAREIRVGSTPESLDEFASNPARGVVKAGLEEKTLSKMDPLQRNKVVTEARNDVGKQLDSVLKAASDAGKKVDITKPVADAFKKIADPTVAKNAEARLQQILADNGITHPLSQLTPSEARTVQRGLEGFDKEVATDLRRGISAATRKVVPESSELDMQYGDLAGAVKGTQKTANKFARTVPENKLRKWIIGTAATGAGLEGAYHAGKYFAGVPGGH
jgi:hypothetical protein